MTMEKSEKYWYGLEEWERLVESPGDVIERMMDKDIVNQTTWPIKIHVHRQMDIGGEKYAQQIADRIMEEELLRLDEEYGDPDGDADMSATESMREAALAFGRAVVAGYTPWMCEPTGDIIEWTQEMAGEYMRQGEDQSNGD